MSKEIEFGRIARRFDVNISALRVFNNQIGRLAEEHDKNTTAHQNSEFAKIVGISVDELEKLNGIPSEKFQLALTAKKEDGELDGKENETTESLTDEQNIVIQKIAKLDDNEFLLKSLRFFKSSMKTVPIQAFILRRSALITLASHFEYLIAELVHSFFSLYPQALPSEERVLSLSELRAIGSIEDAENHLIEREIDSLLRNTIEKQLDYISTKPLKVNIGHITTYKNRLIEIFQRRNIIVHNDGLTNKIYLSRVPKDVLNEDIKDGTRLDVSEEYLNNAIDHIYLSGVFLIQLCWRQWHKEDIDVADSVYNNLLYDALQEHNYDLIKNLQEFSTKLEFATDRNKRVSLVNHAIALRELKQLDEMEKLINTLDWSSCALEFRVALFALRNERDNLLKILPKAIAAKGLSRQNLEEWPLFSPYREFEEFNRLLENCPDEIIVSE